MNEENQISSENLKGSEESQIKQLSLMLEQSKTENLTLRALQSYQNEPTFRYDLILSLNNLNLQMQDMNEQLKMQSQNLSENLKALTSVAKYMLAHNKMVAEKMGLEVL